MPFPLIPIIASAVLGKILLDKSKGKKTHRALRFDDPVPTEKENEKERN